MSIAAEDDGRHPALTGGADAGPDAQTATDQLQRALDTAYRYLNRRDRTEAETRRRLHQAAIPPHVIDESIAILVDQAVIDDARFARLFVQDKRTLERWGNDRIARSLLQRGIERALVDDALGQDAGHDELGRALELLRERFPVPPQERRQRDRALGALLRKGYDSEVALDALAAYARGSDHE